LLHKLDFLTVVAVRDLSTTYSLAVEDGQEASSAPVPAAVLQHDMQLLVAPDRPGLYLEMAQQLARWAADDAAVVHVCVLVASLLWGTVASSCWWLLIGRDCI
jgi:hypothetical protein